MKIRQGIAGFALVLGVVALAGRAEAQLNRTAVSVNGNDLNNCAPATPCRTFSRAISQTNAGGDVVALDSAGYGPFVVDRSLTVEAAPGVYAGVTGTAGDTILVDAGLTAKVVLRGLHVIGLGIGATGIAVTGGAGEVLIENCVVDGFVNWGIISFYNVRIVDTTVTNTGSGAPTSAGISIDNAGAPVKATLDNVRLFNNPIGLLTFRNAEITARNVVAARNGTGFQVGNVFGGLGPLNLENALATDNTTAGIGVFTGATARLSNSVVTGNAIGVSGTGATVESWGNNKIAGNGTNISGSLTPIGQN